MGDVQSCLACDSKRSAAVQDARVPLGDLRSSAINAKNFHHISSASSVASSTATISRDGSSGLNKVGIGAYFQRSKEDANALVVKSVLRGSPAATCGQIKVGDTILAVESESVYGSSLAGLADKLLGLPNSDVVVTFQSAESNKEYTVVLTRGINVASVR